MKRLLAFFLAIAAALAVSAKSYTLVSPDGKLKLSVDAGATLTYSLEREGTLLLSPAPIGVTLEDGTLWGPGIKVKKAVRRSVDTVFPALLFKRATVRDHFNELTLQARDYSVVFRAYDDGVAYRFVTRKPVTVQSEEVNFSFPEDWTAYIPYVGQHTETLESQYYSSCESQYSHHPVSAWNKERIAFLPITVDAPGGVKLCITEADLRNYPGLYLYNGDASTTLRGRNPGVPKEVVQGGHNMLQGEVQSRYPYIARDADTFPWRVVVVAAEDKDLAQSDMVYRLAKPAAAQDWSWVKPGKVAWDWWNDWNLYGVDFPAGINNETYKYYIDFAASKGLEYVILDEGWAVNLKADLMQVVPEIDLPMLASYAESKGVGLILWAGYQAFDKDMEGVCAHYSKMGIKGWKIDFMDRDDQDVVRFYERAAATAAKYRMTCDFHGAYKPTGLSRTYPNILNYEGVFGLEQMKWAPGSFDQITYDVTIPFVRLVAGPADYTQGAMRNATPNNYRPVNSEAMSQGTRCHQLAEYVIFDAPLTMLCDSPSNYLREPECTDFIAGIPTVWDETRALDGIIGEYVVMARRKGDRWWIGALGGLEPRDLTLDLSFIGPGQAVVFSDGVNAHRAARDYKRTEMRVPERITIHLAPGGGWVMGTAPDTGKTDKVLEALHNPQSPYVAVVSHRGDWRNYPENSIPAIESVIRMGVDMVELDIKRTRDGVLVLCHDHTVDRTTTGSGRVSDLTYAEILRFNLKRGHGVDIPGLKMPTLKEALAVCKDRITVNVDQGYDFYDEVLSIAKELGVTDQILIKGGRPWAEVLGKLQSHPENLMYMPVVSVNGSEKDRKLLEGYLAAPSPQMAYELCFGQLTDEVRQAARRVLDSGSKLWVNTIWGSLCGGFDDDRAFDSANPGAVYGPILELGASIIQTDRPDFLIGYLESVGRR